MALSSAYSATDVFGVVGWSAEKTLNKTVDSIAPCEPPARIGDEDEVSAPSRVTNCQFLRYKFKKECIVEAVFF